MRNVGGMLAGLVVAVLLISLVQAASTLVYPLPEGLDVNDQEAMGAHIATLPAGAFLFVLGGYFLGTSVGAWLASRLHRLRPPAPGVTVGCLLFAAGVGNLLALPHPGWFMILCLLDFPLATWLGVRLATRDAVDDELEDPEEDESVADSDEPPVAG